MKRREQIQQVASTVGRGKSFEYRASKAGPKCGCVGAQCLLDQGRATGMKRTQSLAVLTDDGPAPTGECDHPAAKIIRA